jgi:hypothetical protein
MARTRSKTTLTSELRQLMIEECIDDTTNILIESAIDIVNAESEALEQYELCAELHANVLNYCADISKLHNTLLFNDAGDPEQIKEGLTQQYQFLIEKMRQRRDA